MGRPISSREQFLNHHKEKYVKDEKSGCWNWLGVKSQTGYGMFWCPIRKRSIKAHRISYEIHKGKIQAGLIVMHSCDNRRCVNPEHLSVGTHKDNAIDCKNKNRHTAGERNTMSKLTRKQVVEIRRMYVKNRFGCIKISRIFNMSPKQINRITRNIDWKGVS